MKRLRLATASLAMTFSTFGQSRMNFPAPGEQPYPDGPFHVHNVANIKAVDSIITLTNTNWAAPGESKGTKTGKPSDKGQLCATFYAFESETKLISCCSCNVPAGQVMTISAKNDLASNTLSPVMPDSLVVKIAITEGGSRCVAITAGVLNGAAFLTRTDNEGADEAPFIGRLGLAGRSGLITTMRTSKTQGTNDVNPRDEAESRVSSTTVSAIEIDRMSRLCADIRASGSGYGICKSCKLGGIGPSAK